MNKLPRRALRGKTLWRRPIACIITFALLLFAGEFGGGFCHSRGCLDAMKTSPIVTTYERPDALAAVLRSIGRQSLRPGAIIPASDGSGPDPAKVVRNPEWTDPRRDAGVRLKET